MADKDIISLDEERNKRLLDKIRKENEGKLEGIQEKLSQPEFKFFGERFDVGDLISTKKEPFKNWLITERNQDGDYVVYKVRLDDEHSIPAEDVARGARGFTVYELPKNLWDIPGKGLPPTTASRINNLIKIANNLDKAGLFKDADKITDLITKLSKNCKNINRKKAKQLRKKYENI